MAPPAPRRSRSAHAVAAALAIGACTPDTTGPDCREDPDAFEDHTRACIENEDAFMELAGEHAGDAAAVKLTILSLADADARRPRFMDTTFYQLHDEYYMYRMLNGQPFEGEDELLPYDGHFESVADIYAWAYDEAVLPLGLAFLGERLYSGRFYDLWRQDPGALGLAVLVHYDAREEPTPRDEIWAFELEHGDDVSHDELVVYFELIESRVGSDIGGDLQWLVRSQAQEALAQTMEADELAYHDRILRYADLTAPGEVSVYNSGLTAGRLRFVRAGEPITQSTDNDVLVFEETPDYLPPCRGLITSQPQTPLAHINILSKSRGIPNLSVSGVIDDPYLDQIARVRGPVAILAVEPDEFALVEMSKDDYATWLSLQEVPPKSVPAVETAKLPYVQALNTMEFAEAPQLRPIIGGKSAGMLALQDAQGVELPSHPMAITIRAYAEHMVPLADRVHSLLAQPEFVLSSHFKARYLALEGEADYDARYSTPIAQAEKAEILARPAGDVLADVVRDGGLRSIVRNQPIDPATLESLQNGLKLQFLDHSAKQGLRFRSSSNVEDIEGFNGAGLYTSKTGFLYPDWQSSPEDQKRTVEWALQKVWASYWGSEAFEERMLSNVDHISGGMGVLVHARFDDPLETANGVIRMTRMPPWADDAYDVEIDSQRGAVSVTNPEGGALPEVVYMHLEAGSDTPTIDRAQASTLEPVGEPVLSDGELLELFEQSRAVADLWLEAEQAQWPAAMARQSLSLDLEYRRVAEGWPARIDGPPAPARLVIKQSRSLDPDASQLPQAVAALPFPRDLLARARRVERWTCSADSVSFVVHESLTDAFSSPDLGYSQAPFTASVEIEILEDLPGLGLGAGELLVLDHLGIATADHPGLDAGAPWALELATNAIGQALGLQQLVLEPGVRWELRDGAEIAEGSLPECEYELLHSSPDELLLSLLEAAP